MVINTLKPEVLSMGAPKLADISIEKFGISQHEQKNFIRFYEEIVRLQQEQSNQREIMRRKRINDKRIAKNEEIRARNESARNVRIRDIAEGTIDDDAASIDEEEELPLLPELLPELLP